MSQDVIKPATGLVTGATTGSAAESAAEPVNAVTRLLAHVLAAPVVWRGGAVDDPQVLPPWPAEAQAVARAVPRRQQEFAAGRFWARQAMQALGQAPCALPSGPDRAPVWPAGLVGSISHSGEVCAAAVAHQTQVRSLGVDIEGLDRATLDMAALICTPAERSGWLAQAGSPEAQRQRLALLFCLKEAVYKAQYPLTRGWLDFTDAELQRWEPLDAQRWAFEVVLRQAPSVMPGVTAGPEAGQWPAGTVVSGLCCADVAWGYGAAAVSLPPR